MKSNSTANYAQGMLMVLGSGVGLMFGVVADNIPAGLLIGSAFGLVFGICVSRFYQR